MFVLALGLRLGHLQQLRASYAGTELFSAVRVDARHHWLEAGRILDGDPWLADGAPWKAPGYSYFLAGLASVFGRSPGNLRWPLACLGALNCALLVLLARRFLPPGWSVAAGSLAAVNGLLIVYDAELYHPTLLIALNLPVLLLLARPAAGTTAHAAAGALIGLAVQVHAGYLFPAALLTPWIARRRRRHAAAFVLALAAGVSATTLTNVFVRNAPVLISWNGGINLYAANHPNFDQYAGNGTFAWGRLLRTPRDAGIEAEHELDRLYHRLALRQAARFPLETLSGLARKALIFLSPVEYASNFRIYELREHSSVAALTLGRWGPLWVPFGLWGPAALVGLVWLLRKRVGPAWPLLLWCSGVMSMCVLFFNTARFRAPVVFFSAIAVTAAGAALQEARKRKDRRGLVYGFAAFGAIALVLAATAVPQRVLPLPLEWVQAAELTRQGRTAAAERWAEKAVERDPASPIVRQFVSRLYGDSGKLERQRQHLQRLLELPDLEPDLVDTARQELADGYLAEGRLEEARRELELALAVGIDSAEWRGYPHYAMGLGPVRACLLGVQLAGIEIRLGRREVALARVAQLRDECPDTEKLGEAIERLEFLAGVSPED